MADKAHQQTDKILAEMETHLSAIYEQAKKGIYEKVSAYFKQFEKIDAQKRKLVEDGKLTQEEYTKWRRNKIMYSKHWTNLKEQLAEEYANVNRTAFAYINGKLPDVYALNYNDIGAELDDKIKGYSFELVDAQTVKNLATSNETLLPYKYLNGVKDVRWNTKKVNAAVLQGILQGESIPKLAKRLRSVTEMNKTSAIRNARTTVTSAECKGRQDSYEKAEKDGIKLKREWITAIDYRTRHTHRLLDGQLAEVDKPFKSELGPIMYPGDPSADPANVYNCRCTIAAKVISIGGVQINEKQIGTVDYSNEKDVLRKLKEFEKETVNLDYEMNYTVTSDGKIWKAKGDESFIDLSSITSGFEGSYTYHNHPKDKTHYSFGAQDVAFFLDSHMKYAKSSDDLFEYTMERTSKTLEIDFDTVYNMFNSILKKEVMEMKWYGRIDPDLDEYHEALKILSEKYNFKYKRAKK